MASCMAVTAAALLTGCQGFFAKPTTTSTTSSTSNSGDYLYVTNVATTSVSAFSVSGGAVNAIGSYSLTGLTNPGSVVVSRQNTFVYVGGQGGIQAFSIGSNGALTAINGGVSSVSDFVSMATSPDGNWLFALDAETLALDVYAINSSSGVLTGASTSSYVLSTPTAGVAPIPHAVRISANGDYIAVALGQAGDLFYTFNTSTGVLTLGPNAISPNLGVTNNTFYDNAVEFDTGSDTVFFARQGSSTGTSEVASYTIAANGGLSPKQTIACGNVPYGLAFDKSGTYLYVANRSDSTISGYALTSGSLTQVAGSPFSGGTNVQALVHDNSGSYIAAAAIGGGSDLTLYALDAVTLGKLDPVSVAVSDTDPAESNAIAATH